MTAPTIIWAGKLHRDGDTLRGIARDLLGWSADATVTRRGDGDYDFALVLHEPPDALRIEAVDGAAVDDKPVTAQGEQSKTPDHS